MGYIYIRGGFFFFLFHIMRLFSWSITLLSAPCKYPPPADLPNLRFFGKHSVLCSDLLSASFCFPVSADPGSTRHSTSPGSLPASNSQGDGNGPARPSSRPPSQRAVRPDDRSIRASRARCESPSALFSKTRRLLSVLDSLRLPDTNNPPIGFFDPAGQPPDTYNPPTVFASNYCLR